MIILQVGLGLLACFLVAQFLVVLPSGVDSYQLKFVLAAVAALVWIGVRTCWLTVLASVGAVTGLFAFARVLYRLLSTLPNPTFDGYDGYLSGLALIGTTICVASLLRRNRG